jgi:fibronectin-binding autotransporter adhesin
MSELGAVPRVQLFAGSICFGLIVPFGIAPVSAQTLVTGNTNLSGTINGGNAAGYFVSGGGTLTVNNGILQNFTTTGGAGSGGGLGAGGAIFINSGGTAILNGVSLSHDTAIGGVGGTNSKTGGLFNNGAFGLSNASPGAAGTTPAAAQDNGVIFGGGSGNGFNGGTGTSGGAAVQGYGGTGGAGQFGTPGWSTNPTAIANVAAAAQGLVIAADNVLQVADASAGTTALQAALDALSLASLIGVNGGGPTTSGLTPGFVDASTAVAVDLTSLIEQGVATGLGVTQATQAQVQANLALTDWNTAAANGTLAQGGSGGNGGSGGAGSFGFGGGSGGKGRVGAAGGTSGTSEGNSGNGGAGGAGGFGAGGGAGGFGASSTGDSNQGSAGSGGAGGAAGFGAGVGSTGGVVVASTPGGCSGVGIDSGSAPACGTGSGGAISQASGTSGGGGGSGYGGAIFVNNGGTLLLSGNATFGGNDAFGGASSNGGVAGNGVGTDLFMMAGSSVLIAPGAGNVITFNGTIADNSTASISSPIPVGSGGGLTTGAGLTIFNGANTYSGQTVITAGALQAIDGVGLPTHSNLNFAGADQFTGGVFQSSGTFIRAVGTAPNDVQWTGSGGFAAIGGGLTVSLGAPVPGSASAPGGTGQPLTWGADNFVSFGNSLIFGSANSTDRVTFTNDIAINGETASFLVANNGNAHSDAALTGVLSGPGNVSIGGGGYNGTLNLAGVNTYTGSTTINSGTLALIGTGSIATSASITANGVFDISQTTAGALITTLSGTDVVGLGAQTLNITAGSTTFGGVIADGGIGGGTQGNFTVSGGTQTLTGANTFTGATSVAGGATLALSGAGSLATSSGVVDNGTFDISQTTTGASIKTLSGTNTGVVGLGAQTLNITAGSTTFGGVIADGGIGGGTQGNFTVSGGTQTLTGTNTFTGATSVAANAMLALSGTGSIATSSGVADNGTFDISQTTTGVSIKTLSGTNTGVVGLGGNAQTLNITAGSTTFGGVIADGGIGGGTQGNFTVSGGTQTLIGTNTFTGATSVAGGATLALSGTGSIATSSGVADNGTLDISQTTTGASIKTLSGTNTGVVGLGAQTLNITAGSTTFGGVIADGGLGNGTQGNLIVSGGTQTLSGSNTFTGGTMTVSGATLALTGSGTIAASSLVWDNGLFDLSKTTAGTSITTLMGSGSVALGSKTLSVTAGSTTFGGVIADGGIGGGTQGNFTVSGGTQTLTGTNTFTGATSVAANAMLALSGTGSIATSSGVADNGTFDISQTTTGASIKTLSGTGVVGLGAQTLNITAGSTTFGGMIADGGTKGNFTVSGGTQTLSGSNIFTGATSISSGATLALTGTGSIAASSGVAVAGTLNIANTTAGASITTLSGGGSVVLGSDLLTVTAGGAGMAGTLSAGIFSGVMSGLGGFAITGGHEELTGINTYSGGTTVKNATLSINSGASLGISTGALTLNNGTLVADANISTSRAVNLIGADIINTNSFAVSLSGNIGGTGALGAFGGGTLNLTGNNTYSGGTVVAANTALTTNSSAALGTGPVVLLSASGTAINLFTGTANVVGPLDVVNGATPELIILPGDVLGGVGTVNVRTVIQGTQVPGDDPGTLIYTAPLSFMSGSTLGIEIDGTVSSAGNAGGAGTYSSVIVTGAGNTFTAGGTIAPVLRGINGATNTFTPAVTTSFTVVQAAGGVLGSFTGLTQPDSGLSAGTRFDALYSTNAITLYVTPADYQNLSAFGTTLNGNQNQVASALNALRGTAGVRNSVMATGDFNLLFKQQPQNLPTVFNSLSGEDATGAKTAAFQMMNQILGLMIDPTVVGRGLSPEAAPPPAVYSYAQVANDPSLIRPAKPVAPDFNQRWSSWASAFGAAAKINGDAAVGSSNISTTTGGVIGGWDYHFSPLTLAGFSVAGGGNSWSLDQGLGSGRNDTFLVGAYARTQFGPAYFSASASIANLWVTTDRTAFGADQLTAKFSAQSYGARVEAGYSVPTEWITVTPLVAAQVQGFRSPNYSETDAGNGGFGLSYNSQTASDIRSEVGARFDSQTSVAGMPLLSYLRAAWGHDWITNPGMVATFNAASQPGAMPGSNVGFLVNGAMAHDVALLSLSSELRLTPSVAVSTKFDGGEFSRGTQAFGGNATVRVTW